MSPASRGIAPGRVTHARQVEGHELDENNLVLKDGSWMRGQEPHFRKQQMDVGSEVLRAVTMNSSIFVLCLLFSPEDGGNMFLKMMDDFH